MGRTIDTTLMGNPLKIGLTGGIASGKTTVSNFFITLGIPVIDADEISRILVQPGKPAFKHIIKIFGVEMIKNNGHLNRAKLRQLIFADSEQRQRLEEILHPRIRHTMQEHVSKLCCSYCLLSIPLLLETRQQNTVDRVLVVDCSVELQRQRLMLRDKLAYNDAEQIIKAQAKRERRLTIANDVIYNDGNVEQLCKQVWTLHKIYSSLSIE